jgi:hypothetical protein
LLVSETLLGRWLPWVSASVTSVIITGVLGYAIWQTGLGRRQVAPRSRAGAIAWAFFGWLLLTTVMGVNAVYGDAPLRYVLAIAVAFWVAHDNLAAATGRRDLMNLILAAAALASLTAVLDWPHPAGPDERARSVLGSPTLLGALLCLAIPLWLGTRRRWRGWIVWIARALLAAVCVTALALAESRLAIVAVVLAVLGFGALRARGGPWGRKEWLIVAACLLVAALAGGLLLGLSGHESSGSHRAFIWQTCLRLLSQPRVALLGTGIGAFSDGYSMSRPWVGTDRSDVLAVVRDAHNDPLHLACVAGLPGGLLFMVLAVWAVAPLFGANGPRSPTLVGVRLALLAWLVNGTANGSVDVLPVAVPAFLLLGSAIGAGAGPTWRRVVEPIGFRRTATPLVAVLLLLPWASQQIEARAADLLLERADDLSQTQRLEALRASVGAYPRPASAIRLALSEDPQAAVAILEDAAEAWPWNGEIRYQLARQLASTERSAALKITQRAVELDPYNPYYLRQLAALRATAGDEEQARPVLTDALELFRRTLEVATARHGAASPQAEALRGEIDSTQAMLGELGG